MDPKLQQVLADYMESLLTTMKEVGTYAKDQVPKVVQEKLAFTMAMDITWIVMWLFIFGVMYHILVKYLRPAVAKEKNTAGLEWFPIFGVGIITLIAVMWNLYEILEIWLAPRLFIIEWVTSLAKQASGGH